MLQIFSAVLYFELQCCESSSFLAQAPLPGQLFLFCTFQSRDHGFSKCRSEEHPPCQRSHSSWPWHRQPDRSSRQGPSSRPACKRPGPPGPSTHHRSEGSATQRQLGGHHHGTPSSKTIAGEPEQSPPTRHGMVCPHRGHGPVAARRPGLGRDHSHQRLLVPRAQLLGLAPVRAMPPGSTSPGHAPNGQSMPSQAWLQSIWGGARCYPPYDATPQEGQEHEAGHHSPQGDEASEASEDHLAQFAAIFPDYDQVFQEGQEDSKYIYIWIDQSHMASQGCSIFLS